MCCCQLSSVGVQMTIAAMAASMNPSLVARQNTGTDSEEVRAALSKMCASSAAGQQTVHSKQLQTCLTFWKMLC